MFSERWEDIPRNYFCATGNCTDCIYWKHNNHDPIDLAYCTHYGSYLSYQADRWKFEVHTACDKIEKL